MDGRKRDPQHGKHPNDAVRVVPRHELVPRAPCQRFPNAEPSPFQDCTQVVHCTPESPVHRLSKVVQRYAPAKECFNNALRAAAEQPPSGAEQLRYAEGLAFARYCV